MQSQRASEIGYEYAVNYSFLPWRFLTLLMANLFGTPADGSYLLKADAYWEDAIYIGLLPVCLAFAALIMAFMKKKANDAPSRRGLTIFLAILALIASLIALGKYTSLFPFLYKYIPTFDLFQAPARWMIWLVFALSLMAGFGADEWRKPGKRGRFWLNLSLALGITMTFISIVAGYPDACNTVCCYQGIRYLWDFHYIGMYPGKNQSTSFSGEWKTGDDLAMGGHPVCIC